MFDSLSIIETPSLEFIDNYDLIALSKKFNFYQDIHGVALRINKLDITMSLGGIKFFILNCSDIKRLIPLEKPTKLDYLRGFKGYLEREANKIGDWFTAQNKLAEKLEDCLVHCPYLEKYTSKPKKEMLC